MEKYKVAELLAEDMLNYIFYDDMPEFWQIGCIKKYGVKECLFFKKLFELRLAKLLKKELIRCLQ